MSATNDHITEEIKGYECDLENPFAFMSYAHDEKDAAIVKEAFYKLYRLGYNLWIDMANLPHDRNSWEKAADRALMHHNNTCRLIFFFRSESSLVRPTVLRELSTFSAVDERRDNIIVIDIRKEVGVSDLEVLYDRFCNSLAGDDYKCCADIFNIVSTSSSAIRLHEDAGDNIDKLVDLMAAECVKHQILQHFKIHEKMESILHGDFSIKLKPDQEQAFQVFVKLLGRIHDSDETSVILVKGKPGTGKTTLAMKMLMHALGANVSINYVTKSGFIRQAYASGVNQESRPLAKEVIKMPGDYVNAPTNSVDVIIADEAQLLGLKSGVFNNLGENQTAEIINAAKLAVFILDDDQRISLHNHGSVAEIEACVRRIDPYGDNYYPFELLTQTRCRGADSYIELVDSILNIGGEHWGRVVKTSPYTIKVCDSARELHDLVAQHLNENESAGILAGYCWNWSKEGREDLSVKDIVVDDLALSWMPVTEQFNHPNTGRIECALPIYMVQGLEYDYVGVIIGPDLKFKDGKVVMDFAEHAATDGNSFRGYKAVLKSGDPVAINEMTARVDSVIRNVYRILLTRGLKGCYVYCVDAELNEYMKHRVKRYDESEM